MSLFATQDVDDFRADRIAPIAAAYAGGQVFSTPHLLQQLQAAEAEVSRRLRVQLEPTVVFAYPPTPAETDALDAAKTRWIEEASYDYDSEYFMPDRWGFIVTRQAPIVELTFVRLSYPNPTESFFNIPPDWARVDKRRGHIRFVPASQTAIAPLGAFILQALGGGSSIPAMIQLKYTAGLKGVKTDPQWADLLDVIYKMAALRVMKGLFLPTSGSISADGLSQSMSVKMQDYDDQIEAALFGPKGSNGGLFASIHGVVTSAIGVLA